MDGTGNGLEASASKISERSLLGAKGTGATLLQSTVGDGYQTLSPQRYASDTFPKAPSAAYCVPGTGLYSVHEIALRLLSEYLLPGAFHSEKSDQSSPEYHPVACSFNQCTILDGSLGKSRTQGL